MSNTNTLIGQEDLLKHWQGHRALTRRVIEAFPEKELFDFSIGGMRSFAKLVHEMLAIAGPGLKAIVEQVEKPYEETSELTTKTKILEKWDQETEVINTYFRKITTERFAETFNLFGEYKFPVIDNIFYFIDNEIHHRGQGYVYLRALGIEPPFFWER